MKRCKGADISATFVCAKGLLVTHNFFRILSLDGYCKNHGANGFAGAAAIGASHTANRNGDVCAAFGAP